MTWLLIFFVLDGDVWRPLNMREEPFGYFATYANCTAAGAAIDIMASRVPNPVELRFDCEKTGNPA